MLGLASHLYTSKMLDKPSKRTSRKISEFPSNPASIAVGSFHMVKWKDELCNVTSSLLGPRYRELWLLQWVTTILTVVSLIGLLFFFFFLVKDKAEIIQRRKDENDDEPQFYVHYCGCKLVIFRVIWLNVLFYTST